jgi:hypothetical protein
MFISKEATMKKGLIFALVAGLFMFMACKDDAKKSADPNAVVTVPNYEVLNKMTDNSSDYIVDIVAPDLKADDANLEAIAKSIAKKEVADYLYIFNVKDTKKGAKEYTRQSSGLIGVVEKGTFVKK